MPSIVTRLVCHVKNHPNAVVMTQDGRMFRSCPDCTFESKGIDLAPTWRLKSWMAGDPNGPRVPIGVRELQTDQDPCTRRLLQAIVESWPEDTPPQNESSDGRGPLFTADERQELFTDQWPVGKQTDDGTKDGND